MTDAKVLPAPAPLAPKRGRTSRRLAVVFVVLGCAAALLIYKGLVSATVYFKTANQAIADRSALGSSTFQIEGLVVPGTVHYRGAAVTSFQISSDETRVLIENTGTPTSLFQPNIPVVLVGHFESDSDVFFSDQIIVKHTNEYIAAHPDRVRAPDGKIH